MFWLSPPVKGLSSLTFPPTSVPGDMFSPEANAPLKNPTRPPIVTGKQK